MMNKEVIGGIVGTSVSAVGTGLQTNELLQTISLVLTILGTLITIIMAIYNWWRNAKKDGKISEDEIEDGLNLLNNGIDKLKDDVKKGEKDNNDKDGASN